MAAAFIAILSGLKDARLVRPTYGWATLSDSVHRRDLFQEGSKEITKIFVVPVIIDLVYEVIVFHSIYLGQSLIVAAAVALLPYVLIRGPINRIVRRCHLGHSAGTLTELHGRIRYPPFNMFVE